MIESVPPDICFLWTGEKFMCEKSGNDWKVDLQAVRSDLFSSKAELLVAVLCEFSLHSLAD